ncbi:uncharacterized protein C19orf47 homolog [Ceratina calcarata]|uniref:Uncharacterized protein C19orf47 homolog n=1 Tax=Ceratina calcarata TaxID=156304 RepID=A0AAJ7IUM5_9HYME|nr:uncharacterized protein C19orf47 homolog [Ceratina calcarata]
MAAPLSAYWVKFFKGAGFPLDVATKHAVVFSNNRIKPDMLPDLDKPSLKDMGITLMGDMIAILRYAKKVVEDTTCERFLVDSEDNDGPPKTIVKKVTVKGPTKTVVPKLKSDAVTTKKVIKIPTSSVKKPVVAKKTVSSSSSSSSSNIFIDLANQKKQTIHKRKLQEDEDDTFDNNNEDEWQKSPKKMKAIDKKDDKVGYTVILPKGSTSRSQQILKKIVEQKRTVFDRLGDSSVTSTTNPIEASPTFNVTGLGKDVLKRSVFNRLGDKDAKMDNTQTGILKNGVNSTGILKTKTPSTRTSMLTSNKVVAKNVGTMRADQEVSRKVMSTNAPQLVKATKRISFNNHPSRSSRIIKSNVTSGKLASERLTSIPAKARLGVVKQNGVKQVTFNKVAKVAYSKRPDVFSRLGI